MMAATLDTTSIGAQGVRIPPFKQELISRY